MLRPKVAKPTKAEEREAYRIATDRDENSCVKCRRGGPVERDHRQNRQGGNTVASNIQCLCRTHHQWKTEHPEEALADGYAVPRWAVPSEFPARRWLRTFHGVLRAAWVLLDDHGSWVEIDADEAARRMRGEL